MTIAQAYARATAYNIDDTQDSRRSIPASFVEKQVQNHQKFTDTPAEVCKSVVFNGIKYETDNKGEVLHQSDSDVLFLKISMIYKQQNNLFFFGSTHVCNFNDNYNIYAIED